MTAAGSAPCLTPKPVYRFYEVPQEKKAICESPRLTSLDVKQLNSLDCHISELRSQPRRSLLRHNRQRQIFLNPRLRLLKRPTVWQTHGTNPTGLQIQIGRARGHCFF